MEDVTNRDLVQLLLELKLEFQLENKIRDRELNLLIKNKLKCSEC